MVQPATSRLEFYAQSPANEKGRVLRQIDLPRILLAVGRRNRPFLEAIGIRQHFDFKASRKAGAVSILQSCR